MTERVDAGAPVSAPLDEDRSPSRWVPTPQDLAISDASYRWTNRLFKILERLLSVKLNLHNRDHLLDGEIFLFNHFARFETFIPQYLIYQNCGAFSRSIAASEFFSPDEPMSRYLLSVGAVPNNLPGLLPFLASEVLRGRKVIVFPEGGMVKDRRVVDETGRYSVFSRTANARRKHHSGAAVLALGLEAFKQAVARSRQRGDGRRLRRLADAVELSTEALVEACERPTTIVPSNITFYPIRVGENLLSKGAELIDRGLSRRLSEELMIEGNILLKDTDMDIRLGRPVRVSQYWRWWERPLVNRGAERLDSIAEAFDVDIRRGPWSKRMLARCLRREVERVRDDYMHRMYTTVSVNLSHLASVIMLSLLEMGLDSISAQRFRRMLYRCVREVQRIADINLHHSVANPDVYLDLPWCRIPQLEQFLATVVRSSLIELTEDGFRFLPKLRQEHHFDVVRLENLVEVYANEVQPLPQVGRAVRAVIASDHAVDDAVLSRLQAEDELLAHRQDVELARARMHESLQDAALASAPSEPFLLEVGPRTSVGVVLIHGFLASPAEMRPLADALHARGWPVYGVRLKGHGTSPLDLRERSYEDWLVSTRRGVSIMQGLSDRVVVVGFSTGGTLALNVVTEPGSPVAGVCAICAPVRFRNPHMRLIPLVHQANRLVRSLSSLDGVKSFSINSSENPHINYSHMPVQGLYELRRLVDATLERLGEVQVPVRLIQASLDPVVVPDSVEALRAGLSSTPAEVFMVESDRHGIAYANVGATWQRVAEFVESFVR